MAENAHLKAALTQPCAECGHIDWRSDGYLDPLIERAEKAEAERDRLRAALVAAQDVLADLRPIPDIARTNSVARIIHHALIGESGS